MIRKKVAPVKKAAGTSEMSILAAVRTSHLLFHLLLLTFALTPRHLHKPSNQIMKTSTNTPNMVVYNLFTKENIPYDEMF
jgi:hypothetical protein